MNRISRADALSPAVVQCTQLGNELCLSACDVGRWRLALGSRFYSHRHQGEALSDVGVLDGQQVLPVPGGGIGAVT